MGLVLNNWVVGYVNLLKCMSLLPYSIIFYCKLVEGVNRHVMRPTGPCPASDVWMVPGWGPRNRRSVPSEPLAQECRRAGEIWCDTLCSVPTSQLLVVVGYNKIRVFDLIVKHRDTVQSVAQVWIHSFRCLYKVTIKSSFKGCRWDLATLFTLKVMHPPFISVIECDTRCCIILFDNIKITSKLLITTAGNLHYTFRDFIFCAKIWFSLYLLFGCW